MPTRSGLLLVTALLLAPACGKKAPSLEGGDLTVAFAESGALEIRRGDTLLLTTWTGDAGDPNGDPLRRGAAYAPFAATNYVAYVEETFGFFGFDDDVDPWTSFAPTNIREEEGALAFDLGENGGGTVTLGDDGVVSLRWSAPGNRTAMTFACTDTERFFGTGAQVSAEHRGWRVPIWTAEQGVGKAARGEDPLLFGVEGAHYDSYAPVPFALSSRPLGFFVDDPGRTVFDLCEVEDRLRVEVDHGDFALDLIPGASMAEVLTTFTGRTGRAHPVSRWTFAPWLDIFGGPTAITDALSTLTTEGIPGSVIWAEDWVGTLPALGGENLTYDWTEDTDDYPDLAGVADTIHQAGMRFMVYMNPYVPLDAEVRAAAEAADILVKDEEGQVMDISFPFGEPPAYFDPTAPKAQETLWGYYDSAREKGVDGWMADYGEALPYTSVLADGTPGPRAHNAYPRLWADMNRGYWADRRPDGDFALFSRSGFTGISESVHIHWLGDQLTTFDPLDGFGSVLPLYLSAGLSGLSLTHSDIGGYTSTPGGLRTRELWGRWLAFETFTPFFRTHHTSAPADATQWWSDAGTLAALKDYASWHQRLMPYFAEATNAATTLGWPAVRPIWWGHEEATELYDVEDALLTGDDLLVAPILEEGATSRTVTLPPRSWRRWMTFDGALGAAETGSATASATMDEPIVYVRAGGVLPLLTEDYPSLVVRRPEHPAIDAARTPAPETIEAVRLLLVGGGEDTGSVSGYSLPTLAWTWDGSALTEGPLTAVKVDGTALPACASAGDVSCLDGTLARLNGTQATGSIEVTAGGKTGTLTVQAEGLSVLELDLR